MFLPESVCKAIKTLNLNGYNAYPVGGCVRNHIMGITPDDYDMTTDALPSEIISVFKNYPTYDTGIKHGTVSVMIDGSMLEITTHRIESSYTDNRHPDTVFYSDNLEEDLKRRDFTMNAIAYDHRTNSFIDPYSGISDIKSNIIRAVGEPQKRFHEDGLRILRALRFSSVLGFDIENNTSLAIHDCKHLLKNISPERIFAEFTKLLCGKNVRSVLRNYSDAISVFIPEIVPMIGFEQQNPHHCYDVYEHTIAGVEAIAPDPVLRWTMFLHDIGKPETFFRDERGGHFYGHYKNSSIIADSILTRLRSSNQMRKRITTLIYNHDSVIPETQKSVRKLITKLGYDTTIELFSINRADAKAQAPHQIKERLEHIDKLEELATAISESDDCLVMRQMAINGNDLIEIGIPKGKIIGDILGKLFNDITEDNIPNTKEALIKRALELFKG